MILHLIDKVEDAYKSSIRLESEIHPAFHVQSMIMQFLKKNQQQA